MFWVACHVYLTVEKRSSLTCLRPRDTLPVVEPFFTQPRKAKRLIREESATVSEIAERLGYSSLHYFSKQFKHIMDMTPSDYARSITARAERIRGKPPDTADSGNGARGT